MAELMAKEEDVITADLASIPPERPDGPKLVKEQEPETLARAATLVQRAQRGDERAFATLYRLHNKLVYSVCLRMTKDVAEAEDLTQEGFHPGVSQPQLVSWRFRLFHLAVPGCRFRTGDQVAREASYPGMSSRAFSCL